MLDESNCPNDRPNDRPPLSLQQALELATDLVLGAMAREGKTALKAAVQRGNQRFTFGLKQVRRPKAQSHKGEPLPDRVASESKAIRRVFAVLREMRDRDGNDKPITVQDVFHALKSEYHERTVFRALKRLRALDQVYCHPTARYRIGARSELTISECHVESSCKAPEKE